MRNTVRSFKFIIKVGHDFKIRLATQPTPWFVKVALQNSIQNMKLRVNSYIKHLAWIQLTVNSPFHTLHWTLKRHPDNSNQGVSGVANIILKSQPPPITNLDDLTVQIDVFQRFLQMSLLLKLLILLHQ
jgi:hypothetical protein